MSQLIVQLFNWYWSGIYCMSGNVSNTDLHTVLNGIYGEGLKWVEKDLCLQGRVLKTSRTQEDLG